MNPIINLDMKVSELINQETGDWRRDVLEANFFPRGVDIILKMKTVVSVEDFGVGNIIVVGSTL